MKKNKTKAKATRKKCYKAHKMLLVMQTNDNTSIKGILCCSYHHYIIKVQISCNYTTTSTNIAIILFGTNFCCWTNSVTEYTFLAIVVFKKIWKISQHEFVICEYNGKNIKIKPLNAENIILRFFCETKCLEK